MIDYTNDANLQLVFSREFEQGKGLISTEERFSMRKKNESTSPPAEPHSVVGILIVSNLYERINRVD